jgi:hypothetical protein
MAYWAETGYSKSLNKEINKVGCDWSFFVRLNRLVAQSTVYEITLTADITLKIKYSGLQ